MGILPQHIPNLPKEEFTELFEAVHKEGNLSVGNEGMYNLRSYLVARANRHVNAHPAIRSLAGTVIYMSFGVGYNVIDRALATEQRCIPSIESLGVDSSWFTAGFANRTIEEELYEADRVIDGPGKSFYHAGREWLDTLSVLEPTSAVKTFNKSDLGKFALCEVYMASEKALETEALKQLGL